MVGIEYCITMKTKLHINSLGAVHKLCQRPKGGGVWKMLTMNDEGGGGGKGHADD